jgi:GT2 family glycosyltransferase
MAAPEPVTVSVIIVNWNGKQHLATCLDSLAAQSYQEFETILVDNGSSDGSVDFIRTHYPWVKLVISPDNSGFARGNNLGFAQAGGEYLVTLNNDTQVDPDWLQRLVEVAEDNNQAGMVGSRICAFEEPDLIDSLGVRICADGMSRGAFRKQAFSSLELPEVFEILLPSACAALYRKSMLEQIGWFDEDFFAYCEDTDLGLRGRLAGWQALLARDAVVLHKYSQSGGAFSPFKLFLVERNHYWLVIKNFPARQAYQLPWQTLRRYLAQLHVLRSGRGTGAEFEKSGNKGQLVMAILKGTFAALAGLPKAVSKRAELKQQRSIDRKDFTTLFNQYQISYRELLDDAG